MLKSQTDYDQEWYKLRKRQSALTRGLLDEKSRHHHHHRRRRRHPHDPTV